MPLRTTNKGDSHARRRTRTSAVALFAALAAGCGAAEPSASGAEPGAPDCSQSCVDYGTGVLVSNLVADLYAQNVGARPGEPNVTVACPRGGSATITGRVAYDRARSRTVVDVAFAMTDCATRAANGDLAVSGTVHETGSFDDTPHQALDDAAEALTLRGTIEDAPVDATCALHVSVSTSTSPQVTGSLCGRAF